MQKRAQLPFFLRICKSSCTHTQACTHTHTHLPHTHLLIPPSQISAQRHGDLLLWQPVTMQKSPPMSVSLLCIGRARLVGSGRHELRSLVCFNDTLRGVLSYCCVRARMYQHMDAGYTNAGAAMNELIQSRNKGMRVRDCEEGVYYEKGGKFNLKVPLEAWLTSYTRERNIVFFNLPGAEALTSQFCWLLFPCHLYLKSQRSHLTRGKHLADDVINTNSVTLMGLLSLLLPFLHLFY